MPTPLRAIRVPDDLWKALQAAAHDEGLTASEIIRELINKYLADGNRTKGSSHE